MKRITTCKILVIVFFAFSLIAIRAQAPTPSGDALINKLVEKGILSEKEAKALIAESTETNAVVPSKWKISDAIKKVELFGDVRFRYEYRSADNFPDVTGDPNRTYYRERFRYAVRVGLRGDLFDDFYYGLRLETSSNPRSPWITFGNDTLAKTSATPSSKTDDGINLGQAYLGWKPTSWFEMTVGKMPNPLYTTGLIWDSDINPEGAVEKFKVSFDKVDLFANFGQFLYQETDPDLHTPSDDTFMLAWQVGANFKVTKDISLKVAPVVYNYTGQGQTNSSNLLFGQGATYTGEGVLGQNANAFIQGLAVNQVAINDLLVLEIPAELNFKVSKYNARVFGDFAFNFYGSDRAEAAAKAFPPTVVQDIRGHNVTVGLDKPYTDENKAYQVGVAVGNLGLVYGQTSKKNTWEARTYWQHTEQYAVDVNLLDSDFFEGRANLEGVFAAFAYSITDGIIGTVRYGYAHQINKNLGTGGINPDLPLLNPINNYHLLQLDLTWRF